MSAFSAYDERGLLLKVSEGDERAFRELFSRYADLLGTIVLRFTKSQAHAGEIVQDVFLKIWMSREALAGVENFRVYLYVVSRNQTLNAMRKAMREEKKRREWERHQSNVQPAVFPHEDDAEQLFGLIDQAIHHLPPQQQTAWLLSRRDGQSHRHIAGTMGLSQETVKKHIMAAKATLTHYILSRLSGDGSFPQ